MGQRLASETKRQTPLKQTQKKSIATEHQRRWTTVHRRVLSWCLPAVLIAHRQHILGQKSGSSPSDLQVKTWRAHLPQAVQFQCQISPPPKKNSFSKQPKTKKGDMVVQKSFQFKVACWKINMLIGGHYIANPNNVLFMKKFLRITMYSICIVWFPPVI